MIFEVRSIGGGFVMKFRLIFLLERIWGGVEGHEDPLRESHLEVVSGLKFSGPMLSAHQVILTSSMRIAPRGKEGGRGKPEETHQPYHNFNV